MNKFRKLGYIDYNGRLEIHSGVGGAIHRDTATNVLRRSSRLLRRSKPRTVEEALAQLEERVGTKGRRLFEDFLRKAERLEA